MAVLISGLHRSGSTIVATALAAAGLRLVPDDCGAEARLEDPRFVAINDDVLEAVGAAWDLPPATDAWGGTKLRKLRRRAEVLVAEASTDGPWGWKDPRTALTLPLWASVLPERRLVITLRHPIAVADALRPGGVTPHRALELWRTYNVHLLSNSSPADRIVVTVEGLRADPAILERLVAFAGLPPQHAEEASAVARGIPIIPAPSIDELPAGIDELYARLLAEAGAPPRGRARKRAPNVPAVRRNEELAMLGVEGDINDRIRRSSTNGTTGHPPTGSTLEQRLGVIEAALHSLASTDDTLKSELTNLEERLLRLLEALHSRLESLPASAVRQSAARHDSNSYADLVSGVRRAVGDLVPLGATVAVISRGDDDLLTFFGRQGWHFPQDATGRWLGYHPKNSLAAIAQLETLRALGATYVVVPAPSFWWFEKYADFGERLTSCYVEIAAHPEVCRIFSLQRTTPVESAVKAFLARERAEHGTVEVLDMTSAGDLAGRVPEVEAFLPPIRGSHLPYADRSIAIVAVDSDAPDVRFEAARVATVAVLDLARNEVSLVADRRGALPSVSVIMPVFDNPDLTEAALASLTATLPAAFSGEVIVIDDHSAEETRRRIEGWPERNPLVQVLRNPANLGYLPSIARGLEVATGTYLLLVNNDMVFLDGWLEPLLRTFDDFPDAGAVGGRLLYPDGRLQEAGGMLFADASAWKYGYGDTDNDRPEYGFVRAVDYCSGCLLLTSRAVFDAVGGVDRSFDPGYYEDTDYCLRVRLSGRRIYYQPESVVVHVEGGTAGMDPNEGMKRHQNLNHRRFIAKWGELLPELQPERPDPFDDAALHALVLRHSSRVEATT